MKIKKIFLMLLIILFSMPTNVLAYSNKVILGGDNVGIEVKTKGILVVGLYEIDGELIAKSSGIQIGDYIIKVNENEVNSILDYSKEIQNDSDKEKIKVNYIRKGKNYETELKLAYQNGEYKTGLYVKDSITGIGTLTFIDPTTKKFGALGHEIISKDTNEILNISDGAIYSSFITGITKSNGGDPGEKEADIDKTKKYGTIKENTKSGIFGEYTSQIENNNLYEVASPSEVKIGSAKIFTVLDGENLESFDIQIEKLNLKDDTKNIVFRITDEKLLAKAGGVVQGMSGSPVVQDNKIIGAVTHVIVNNPARGYGIFITNMLEEADN